jgi:phosphate starvation-inducible PhoH-like protein
MNVLKGIKDIEICMLTGADVVRHVLVQKIIEAYDKYEKTRPEITKQRRPVNHAKRVQ